MKYEKSFLYAMALGGAATFFSVSAAAHIRLDSPTARTSDGNDIKTPPCGPMAGSSRNPDNVTMIEAGSTIEVAWTETINHPGHFRIAFDDDGDDSFVDKTGPDDITDPPTLPILLDGIPDDNEMAGGTFSVMVTLPDVECDNCTLQLIQYMTDRNEPYYQCADLTLYREDTGAGGSDGGGGTDGVGGAETGGTGMTETGGAGGTSTGGTMATGGAMAIGGAASGGAASGGAASGGVGTGGAVAATGGMTMDEWMSSQNEESGGCGYAARSRATAWSLWAVGGLFLALAVRRRNRGLVKVRRD